MSMGTSTEENGRDGERQTEREREDRERMRMGPNSLVCSWIALLQASFLDFLFMRIHKFPCFILKCIPSDRRSLD